MKPTADTVFQEAMQLPEDSRMCLVERLLVTMPSYQDVAGEQVVVAESRLQELRSGAVHGVAPEDAIRRARESLGARISA